LIARISRERIIIQEAVTYWDLKNVLDQLNQVLLSKKYKPVYFFEGTPIIGQGGFSVIIKLDRELGELEYRVIKRILTNLNIRVIEEA